MTETLTAQQQRTLSFIEQHLSDHGYPPTVREICDYLNVASSSTAHSHLSALVRKGYLRRDPRKPRAMQVVPW